MANIRAIFKNLVDISDVTPSSANFSPELPASNVGIQGRTRVARTTNTNEMGFEINFPQLEAVSGAAIVRHNLDSDGTWRVRLYSAASLGGTLVYDSGNLSALSGADSFLEDSQYSYHWFSSVNARSALVTVNNSGNADGYLQLARIVLGAYSTAAVNASFGAEFGWDEDTRQTRTTGGSLRADDLASYRTLKCDLRELTEAERDSWQAGSFYVGKRRDFLISLYPEEGGNRERDNTVLVKFNNIPTFQHWVYETFRTKLDVVES